MFTERSPRLKTGGPPALFRAGCRPGRTAFTMVEAVLSVLTVALMTVAAMRTIGTSAVISLVQRDQARSQALAKQLLSEILQRAYSNPGGNNVFGPEAGQTRTTFDDVDDYNGLVDSPPTAPDGTSLPGCTGWARRVTVDFVDATNPNTVVGVDAGLKRVTVTVTSPTGKKTTLVGLRSQYSLYEKAPPTNAQVVFPSWIGIKLQVGSSTNLTTNVSVNPVNQWP